MKEVRRETTTRTMRAFAYSPWTEMAGKSNWREQWYWTIEWTIKTLANSCIEMIDRRTRLTDRGGCSEGPDSTEKSALEPVQSFVWGQKARGEGHPEECASFCTLDARDEKRNNACATVGGSCFPAHL